MFYPHSSHSAIFYSESLSRRKTTYLYTGTEFGFLSSCYLVARPKHFCRKHSLGDHFVLLSEEPLTFYYSGGRKQQVSDNSPVSTFSGTEIAAHVNWHAYLARLLSHSKYVTQ